MEAEIKPRRKSNNRKSSKLLQARCTPEELIEAKSRAELAGVPLPDFIRTCVLGARAAKLYQKQNKEHSKKYIALKSELNKIGSNINQIVRVIHSTGYPNPEQLAGILEYLEKCYNEIIKYQNDSESINS